MNLYIILLVVLTLFSLSLWLRSCRYIWVIRNEKEMALQGILKNYVHDTCSKDVKRAIFQWCLHCLLFNIVVCIWITYISWQTDYSFLAGIYIPFSTLWLLRFFLWGKSDLRPNHVKT